MVRTIHEKEVFLLKPGRYAEVPDQSGEEASFILLVEDDVPTLRLERVILEEAGYEVRVVGSGEEALRYLAKETPALVMLDVGLPGMDGFTTCERIREFSEVPVLMVSGRASTDDEKQGLGAGATEYVAKPFSPQELAGLVKQLFPMPQATPGSVERPLEAGSLQPRSNDNDDPDPFLTPPSQSPTLEPEVGSIPQEGLAGQYPSREADSEIYEGTVRLMVKTTGAISGLLNFVGELRQDPQFRLLRLIANHRKEGMDIWLGLRQPLSLRTVLLNMKGVSQVTIDDGPTAGDNEPRLIVVLSGA